ncbi:glycosyltransferase family 4 protein, partial [Escherichia coli]|nr:glycosyltransferase family 4 protein [Escherichia coli]
MRKRLAHIQVVPKMSGVQQISFDILKNLDPDEFDLYLICGDGTEIENFKKRFQSINVKVIVIPELKREICFSDIKAFFRLLALFKRHKIDIVHT